MRGMGIIIVIFVCTMAPSVWGAYHPCSFDNHTSARLHFMITDEDSYLQESEGVKRRSHPETSYASSMAQRVIAGLEQLAGRSEQNFALIDQLRSQDAPADADLARLRADKAQALKDLAKDNYCSQCLRSKAEIEEEDGVDFNTHLRMISGFPVAAPLKRTEEKERQYDDKISATESDKKRRLEHVKGLRAENKRIFHQLGEGLALWRSAADLEASLLSGQHEQDESLVAEWLVKARMRQAQAAKRMQELLDLGPPPPEMLAEIDLHAQTWRAVVSLLEQKKKLENEKFKNEQKRAQEQRDAERVRVHGAVNRIFTAAASDEYFAGYSPSSFPIDGEVKLGGLDFMFGSLETDNAGDRAEIAAFLETCQRVKGSGGGTAVIIAEPVIVPDPRPVKVQGRDRKVVKN